MFHTIKNALKFRLERFVLRGAHYRLLVIGALIVFRIGAFVPIPGVNAIALASLFKEYESSIIGMFNMFGGGYAGQAERMTEQLLSELR